MDSKLGVADAEEEDSESLSLCEWSGPSTRREPGTGGDVSSFEFSSGPGAHMCTAEEIFECGMIATNSYKPSSCHRRSESLDGARTRLLQPQPAERLKRASSADGPPVRRCGSTCARTSVLQGRLSSSSASRPKWWYLLPFGYVRPPELEMETIRSRQKRQWPPAATSAASAGDGNKMRWKLLRVLSCSRKEAIAVR